MIDPDRHAHESSDSHESVATTLGWRLDVKAAVVVAVALLVVVLALSLVGYGSDDVRPGGEVAPVTETDTGGVSGVEVRSR